MQVAAASGRVISMVFTPARTGPAGKQRMASSVKKPFCSPLSGAPLNRTRHSSASSSARRTEGISISERNVIRSDRVCAAGSGGTYSGLWLGNRLFGAGKRIVGITVCDNRDYFNGVCSRITKSTLALLEEEPLGDGEFTFIDGYKGRGYALSKPEELRFIADIAAKEGVILDPVYTGKAFYGLYSEVKKGTFDPCGNILFIHTGGQYGLFPKQDQISEAM